MIDSGIAILPMSWSSAAWPSASSSAPSTPSRRPWLQRAPPRSERARRDPAHVPRSPPSGRWPTGWRRAPRPPFLRWYMRASASVSAPHAVEALVRKRHAAVGRCDEEPLTASGQRGGAVRRERVHLPGRARSQHTEFVAAHAVGGATSADCVQQRRAEARQQDIAGAVPIGVVVALESVEVEQHERVRCRVPEPASATAARSDLSCRRLGNPVSGSVSASMRLCAEQPLVLAEREGHPDEREPERGHRKPERDDVQADLHSHGEHTEGDHAERDRQEQPVAAPRTAGAAAGDPSSRRRPAPACPLPPARRRCSRAGPSGQADRSGRRPPTRGSPHPAAARCDPTASLPARWR